MTFPNSKRVIYKENPLISVVCQLRFPAILSINSREPFEFQDTIREIFPLYNEHVEHAQELTFKQDKNVIPRLVQSSTSRIKNYRFSSPDEKWHVNLTSSFISLSTNDYRCWEEFSDKFNTPLAALIDTYKPSHFTRTGLRYTDAFSRNNLGLNNASWHELIKPFVLGFLAAEDIPENKIKRNILETEISLDEYDSNVKIIASLGTVEGNLEKQFIIDSDFYSPEKVETDLEAIYIRLHYLHKNSTNFISWVIHEKLHKQMGPSDL